MRRIVVVGGRGFFGGHIAERLPGSLTAGRAAGDLRIDVEDEDSMRRSFSTGDVVVDAAGPFQHRSTRLLEIALERHCDVIDISDSAEYCARIYACEHEIKAAGIRVLTACSSLSTGSAAVIATSRIKQPQSITVRLIPASRYTANRGSAQSMIEAIGKGATWRADGLAIGSVDAVTLPRVWPSLVSTEFIVDAGIPGMNTMLLAASRRRWLARAIEGAQPVLLPITRKIGRREGLLTYAVASTGQRCTVSLSGRKSFLAAVLPAVLTARSLAAGRFDGAGLIPPDRHVDPGALFAAFDAAGIVITEANGG